MRIADDGLFAFLVRYSVYAALPGMWFAYIGGVSPWWGAAIGVTLVFLVGLPARIMRRREQAALSLGRLPADHK